MNEPTRPHAPWCARQKITHASCHALVSTIEINTSMRLLVELNHAPGVPPLVSLTIDRGPRRTLVPLNVPAADELGAALSLAANMARER